MSRSGEDVIRGLITPKRIGWVVGGFILFLLIMSYWPFRSVPVGSRGVITQFGKIEGIAPEGLTFVPPWQRLALFSIRAEQADIENAEGATSDTQPVNTSLTVRYSIFPDKVAEVFEKYSHNGDLSNYVDTGTHEVFKAVTAKYTAPDLIAKRAQVSADVKTALEAKLATYGAQVINIDMRKFAFSPTYMAAINDKVTQEQLRLVAENKLLTVEAEQKQQVAIAEATANSVRAKAQGDADAVKAQADGDAYATLANAKAAAQSLQVQNAALAQSRDVLALKDREIQLKWAENWKGEFPTYMGASAIPYMQMPGPVINK